MGCLQAIRQAISEHTGLKLPPPPAAPVAQAYGKVALEESVGLTEALEYLVPGDGIATEYPSIMEDYGQWCVLYHYANTI